VSDVASSLPNDTAGFPTPVSRNWRTAIRLTGEIGKGSASFQAPGGEPLPFIWEEHDLTGGFRNDKHEYPFLGGWWPQQLNELPQSYQVTGTIRGDNYLTRRNAFITALRTPATVEKPAYLVLPTWGRFPVMVATWGIKETSKRLGQVTFTMTFDRVPKSIKAELQIAEVQSVSKKYNNLAAYTAVAFEEAIDNSALSKTALLSALGKVTTAMAGIIGRIQAPLSTLASLSSAISGIAAQAETLIATPSAYVAALFSVAADIVAAVAGITDALYDQKHLACRLWSKGDKFNIEEPAATAAEEKNQRAVETLFRAVSFGVAALLLPEMSMPSITKARDIFARILAVESSIQNPTPELASALTELRVALVESLKDAGVFDLEDELEASVYTPIPLLPLAQTLGAEADKVVSLNSVSDQFFIKGEVLYV